jgi:hypothetical protein
VRLTLIDRLSTIYQRYNEIPDQGRIDKLFSDPCVLMSMETVAGNYRDVFSAFMNLQMTCLGKARWGNNVPRDIFNIEDIVGFYPDAKFLICVRDARDFALSYRYQWRKEPAGEQADRLKQLYHPIIAALLWKACVKQISKAKCLIPADNLMVLKYEELVNNPRAVVQEVCQFIGEEFEEAMLEVGGHNSSFPTEDKNIFATGVGRWRTQLSREEVYLIQKIAHKELADLGYVSEDIQPNPLMLSYYTMVVPFAFIRLLRVNRALFGPVVPYLFRRLRLLVS